MAGLHMRLRAYARAARAPLGQPQHDIAPGRNHRLHAAVVGGRSAPLQSPGLARSGQSCIAHAQ